MRDCYRFVVGTVLVSFLLVTMSAETVRAQSPADGQLTIAFDTTPPSSYLDPADDSGALRAARSMAGLPGFLCHPGHGRGLDRSQEVHGEGRRGRLQAPAGGPGTLSVRAHDARGGIGARGERAVLAQEAVDQAHRLQGRARPLDAAGQAMNEAERLGFSRLTGSIIPSVMEFALRLDPYPYDPARAKRLLAEAGYPNGFDAGDLTPNLRSPPWGRPRRTIWPRWASARGCARWSGPPTSTRGGRRSSRASSFPLRPPPTISHRASRASSSAAAPTPTAAIRISTTCSASRHASATARSAKPSCIRSSG